MRVSWPNRARRAALAATALLAVAGCAQPAVRTHPNGRAFPTHVLPAELDGITVAPVARAAVAFESVGSTSAVQQGMVWTLRNGSDVVGALEVAELKGGLSTRSETIRAGIRGSVNNGYYRWFKVRHRQWVGVQKQPQLVIYLWLPPRDDEFEILQVSASVVNPERLLQDVISYQEAQ